MKSGYWDFKSSPGHSNVQLELRISDLVQFPISHPRQHPFFPSWNNLKATLHIPSKPLCLCLIGIREMDDYNLYVLKAVPFFSGRR